MATQTIDLGLVFDPEQAAATDNNALSLNGGYSGRSIKDLLGCASWDATYAALSAKKHTELSGLRLGDYLDVTLTSSAYTKQQTNRYVLADVDTYYRVSDSDQTSHHLVFLANEPIQVVDEASSSAQSGCLFWNTTSTNNGTADQKCPYMASNLHAWETNYATVLPEALSSVLLEHHLMLEERYSSSGALTDSNGWSWQTVGKVWSPSETEVYGQRVWATDGWSVGADAQFALMRHNKWRGANLASSQWSWWLRSVRGGSSTTACNVNYYGNAYSSDVANVWLRPRPGFLLRLAG